MANVHSEPGPDHSLGLALGQTKITHLVVEHITALPQVKCLSNSMVLGSTRSQAAEAITARAVIVRFHGCLRSGVSSPSILPEYRPTRVSSICNSFM
jgi:hypothetical protein